MSNFIIILAVASPLISLMVILYMAIKNNISKMNFEKEMEKSFRIAMEDVNRKADRLKEDADFVSQSARSVIEQRKDLDNKMHRLIEKGMDVDKAKSNIQHLIKKHATELFNVREATIWLYDFYKELDDRLIDMLDGEEIDFDMLGYFQEDVSHRLEIIDNKFKETFKVPCNLYKKTKTSIIGERKNGGNDFLTECSLN